MHEDPVYTRWKRRYPRFPGIARCVELLRRRNTQGSLVDIICGELESNAPTHAAELLEAFRAESDRHVRILLLGIIAEAGLPEAIGLLTEQLRSEDERLRHWAEEGLRSLNSREARKVL